jgi:tRNA threonylcarbamoyladenosine biosynthesis protein TsaB
MIILLDTSTPLCRLSLIDGNTRHDSEWQADRGLAKGLLAYLRDHLTEHKWQWSDISGIGVYQGPGSFTGLRIGLTVLNTLADAHKISIVGATGDDWQVKALDRLAHGENDQIVLPLYGSDAHITLPRK